MDKLSEANHYYADSPEGDVCTISRQWYEEAKARLAAYEDTEYTPEEVQEFAGAKKDGRLVELPCKIGAKIFEAGALHGKVFQRFASKEDMLTKIIPGWGVRYFTTAEEAEKALKEGL